MAYDSKTFQQDLAILKAYLGPDTRDDILDQLRELARQVRAMQGLITAMAGEHQPAPAPAARSPFGKALRDDKVILLKKAIEVLLGPHGGQRVQYHKDTAARLLAKAMITPAQHRIWKLSGYLPENVNLRDAKSEAYLMARPA